VSVLHALKYPANSVNGVLLGCFDKDGTVQVQRALPLLHSHLALAPMMDAAFALIDEHCQTEDVKIVGYYHANSNHQHKQPSAVARRIADKIYDVMKEEARSAETCMLMIDNMQLESLAQILSQGEASGEMSQSAGVVLHMRTSAGAWEPASGLEIEGAAVGEAQARLLELVGKAKYQEVVDFDNLVDDCSRSWFTPIVT